MDTDRKKKKKGIPAVQTLAFWIIASFQNFSELKNKWRKSRNYYIDCEREETEMTMKSTHRLWRLEKVLWMERRWVVDVTWEAVKKGNEAGATKKGKAEEKKRGEWVRESSSK